MLGEALFGNGLWVGWYGTVILEAKIVIARCGRVECGISTIAFEKGGWASFQRWAYF